MTVLLVPCARLRVVPVVQGKRRARLAAREELRGALAGTGAGPGDGRFP